MAMESEHGAETGSDPNSGPDISARFDPSDWTRITALPMLVGMTVTAADPGGLWGAVRESTAMAGAITRVQKHAQSARNPLIDAVVARFALPEGRTAVTDLLKSEIKGKDAATIVTALLSEVERLGLLASSKAPEAATGFKTWLMEIAESVAEAGTEGGFLGFGGVKVSPEEAATLDHLRSALGVQATV